MRRTIRDGLTNLVREFGIIDGIAGVATGGIPHGVLVADRLDLPFSYIRSQAKAHGRKNRIEGIVEAGQKVVVVEDLISTGKSSLSACKAIEEIGAEIVGLIAIFSYGLDEAKEKFAEANIKYRSLTGYDTLLDIAASEEYVSMEEIKSLQEWRKSPRRWSENYSKS